MSQFSSSSGNENAYYKKLDKDRKESGSLDVTDSGSVGRYAPGESRDLLKDAPEELLARSSPLFELLEAAREYLALKKNVSFVSDALEHTGMEMERFTTVLEEAGEEYVDQEFLDTIAEKMAEIDEALLNEVAHENITGLVDELEALNTEFVTRYREFFKAEPTVSQEEMLEEIESELSDSEVVTENYIKVEDAVARYLEGEIEEREYLGMLEELLGLIRATRQEYEGSYISRDEWTVEVALGDKLLMDGLREWEEALDFLSRCPVQGTEEAFEEGMEKVFEANKKLILVQLLATRVNEQAQKMSSLKSGSSAR